MGKTRVRIRGCCTIGAPASEVPRAKALDKVPVCDEQRVDFGHRLSLELRGEILGVAVAQIKDVIDRDFWNRDLGLPSPKQVALAAKFGFDIGSSSRRIRAAAIDNIQTQLNLESVESQHLGPGDVVTHVGHPERGEMAISSVQEDGLVFFKGGNGQRAWARNLRKA